MKHRNTNRGMIMAEEKIPLGRRGFLKAAFVTAGSAAGFLGSVKLDAKDGIKIGKISVPTGMTEAAGMCSFGASCGGGGGMCSFGASCAGGGGMCSFGSSCAGS